MDIKNITEEYNKNFYPTPNELIEKMVDGIDWTKVNSVLEPSAGKGNIVDFLNNLDIKVGVGRFQYDKKLDIECIEIDKTLQSILKGKGYNVVCDDFLKFFSYKKYDLIIMNPPFDNGEKHLLKAIEIQEFGGGIICLLNAETLKNPYSRSRKELVEKLEEYNANIQYIKNAFSNSERKTDVEIALIKIFIPEKVFESTIFEKMKLANDEKYDEIEEENSNDLTFYDVIKQLVSHYEFECRCGVELIKEYIGMKDNFISGKDGNFVYNKTLSIVSGGEDISNIKDIKFYIKRTREKYWKLLFQNNKFVGKLTYDLRREYELKLDTFSDYEFNEYNIRTLNEEMAEKMNSSIEETIMKMFDKMSCVYSWNENSENVHYYNGWKTNKGYKINEKVILPFYGYEDKICGGRMDVRKCVSFIEDTEKVFDFLDIGRTISVNVMDKIENSTNKRNIQFKYFTASFYKKGTVHIKFTNKEILDKFNIYAAKNRNWLPQTYGKKKYSDMTSEEKEVVMNFHENNLEEYNNIFNKSEYYIVSNGFNLIEG